MTLVSILIPCYNYGRYLGEAVESALAQTCPATEIIVIDDGSSDETPAVANRYRDRIRYIRTPNQGHGAALNEALKWARGDYYLCLDADNALFSTFVEKTVAVLERSDPALGYVYTQRMLFGTMTGESAAPAYDVDRLKERNYIDTCALVRTDLGHRFGYDPSLKSQVDYDFYLTLAENGYRGILLNEPLFRYRCHAGSKSQTVSRRYRQIEVLLPILRKHKGFYTRQERDRAIRAARNRIQMAIINNRMAHNSFFTRCGDLRAMVMARGTPAQIWNQFRYIWSPSLFRRDG